MNNAVASAPNHCKKILFLLLLISFHRQFISAETTAWIEPKDPLHKAVMNGNIKEAKILINNGYDIEISNGPFRSPLQRAVAMNNIEMARFLLLSGANPLRKLEGKTTMLDQAVANDYYEMAELLTRYSQESQPNLAYINLFISGCALLLALYSYHKKSVAPAHKVQRRDTGRNLRREMRLKPGNDKVYLVTHGTKAHIKYKSLALDKSENGLRLICMGTELPAMHEVLIIRSHTVNETCYYEVKWSQKIGVHANIFMFGVQKKDMKATGTTTTVEQDQLAAA